MWNLISFHLKTVLMSVQDRCMVCIKHTIGEVGHVESHFFPFEDRVNVGAR